VTEQRVEGEQAPRHAGLLVSDAASIASAAIAASVRSPFTFSTAFKRVHGLSPKGYRAQGGLSIGTVGASSV
jgi:AraC-like DNA-binding protein